MSKPQGTYIRILQNEKARHNAPLARQEVANSSAHDLNEFYHALDRESDRELDERYRSMSALIDKLKSGKPLSKEDESRNTVSKAIKQVRKIVENVKDLRQLEGRLSVPLQTVIRAPAQLGTTGLELALVIAVCQVFEVLVRLRRRK